MSATKAHRARLHHCWAKPRIAAFEVSHHKPIEQQHEERGIAADAFLTDMARRLGDEFGIKPETVKALAVSAGWLRARPSDDDEDEAEPKPQRNRGRHFIGGVSI